ncbi:hypothetical protein B0H14DRAFT_2715259 [Mycena olivaceomarginata]|nr:hypothetical protein B0H14DRAFT_2715259 [Mycena olivaceomarginata]
MDKLPPLALPHTLDFVTASSFGSLGTPSPPLSSEAPSPESTRDFDRFNDDASEFSRRSEPPLPQDGEPHQEHDVSDEWKTFDAELMKITANDDASESEEDKPLTSHAPVFAEPLSRPIIALPARRLALATQPTAAPITGPSKFFQILADSDCEDDATYSDSGDEDSDYGHSARRAAPATKRRRTNLSKAVQVPLQQRAAKGKGKGKATGKAKAKAPAKPKRSQKPQILVSTNTAMPTYEANPEDGMFSCPLITEGCTYLGLFETRSGARRHYMKHVPRARYNCLAGCGKSFERKDVYRKHLKGDRSQEPSCKAAKADVDRAI